MTNAELRKHMKKFCGVYQRRLGLGGWRIRLHDSGCGPGHPAECLPYVDYKVADIYFDAEQHPDAAEVERNMLHELLHCVAAPTDRFRDMAYKAAEGRPEVLELLKAASAQMDEQLVKCLEEMYHAIRRDAARGRS